MEKPGVVVPDTIFSFTAKETDKNKRVDLFVTEQFPLYSRSFFQRLIDDGFITINDKAISKAGAPLKTGDIVTVHFPPTRTVESKKIIEEKIPIKIIEHNEHFLILCKPAGLMVHPPSQYTTEVTLTDWLLHNFEDIKNVGYYDRPGIVHRLDKDTSGIMIIPLTNYAHELFGNLFKDRKIEKTYLAVVKGHPDPTGTIDLAVGRDPNIKIKMKAFEQNKTQHNKTRTALTDYKVLEYFDDSSLVEVKPKTGRTHQIRVHFAAIGHPLLGDVVYGQPSKLINRHALHAQAFSFTFNNNKFNFTCNAPNDFQKLLKLLQKKHV